LNTQQLIHKHVAHKLKKNCAEKMTKNLYLNLLLAFIILLIGFYYSSITIDFWTARIIGFASAIISGFALIGFNYKNLPKKRNIPIKPIQILAILVGFSGMFLVIYFFQNLIYSFAGWELEKEYRPANNELARFLVVVVIWVFVEEIYYRRIVAQKIFNQKSFAKAFWISSLVFSIGHWFSDTGLLYAFIGGLILAYLYLKTQSIWLSIFAHLYYNLMTFYITPKISERISDFNTKPKLASLVAIGLILIFIMVFLINYSTKNQSERVKPVGNNV
jgi:membrane protease YdiL (CAAX protease family)